MSKLGIVAGGGELPRRLVAFCRERGQPHFVIAFRGYTDPSTVEGVDHAWVRLGNGNEAVERLHEAGVDELVMIGPIRRPGLLDLFPDRRTMAFLAKAALKGWGDDGVLKQIIGVLEKEEGFKVRGIDDFLGDLLAREGAIGSLLPDPQADADIARGVTVARALGQLDVGQAVVIQQGVVLALEGVEGSDRMIERCGELRLEGPGGVLVKLCKPGQERRVDLPTIGVKTVELAAQAGLRGIACQADHTLVVDAASVGAAADRAGLFVVALSLGR